MLSPFIKLKTFILATSIFLLFFPATVHAEGETVTFTPQSPRSYESLTLTISPLSSPNCYFLMVLNKNNNSYLHRTSPYQEGASATPCYDGNQNIYGTIDIPTGRNTGTFLLQAEILAPGDYQATLGRAKNNTEEIITTFSITVADSGNPIPEPPPSISQEQVSCDNRGTSELLLKKCGITEFPLCVKDISLTSCENESITSGVESATRCYFEDFNGNGFCAFKEGYEPDEASAITTPSPTPQIPPCKEYDYVDQNKNARFDDGDVITGCKTINTSLGTAFNTSPQEFITSLLGVLLSISGAIALILIIYSGYRMMTSNGNPETIQAARETLTSAIVGLLFIIFSLVIIQVIGVDILQLPGFGN